MNSTYFSIPPRRETPERYDLNKEINNLIQKGFKNSISKFLSNPYSVESYTLEEDFYKEWNSEKNSSIPYGSTTLGKGGCAVYTFHQGLRYRNDSAAPLLKDLASILAQEGYYEPGKGTWHNLFDHWGLRRVTDIKEIFDTFDTKESPLVTTLVTNSLYPASKSNSGSHFVNIVGVVNDGFLIDDPNQKSRIFFEFERILPSIEIAWIW